jgi:hypothetical protein
MRVDRDGRDGLLGMHPIGRLLRLAGGGEDGAWIIFEGPEPRGDVGGMLGARPMGNAEIGQDEARRQLADDLVHGILRRAEAAGEIAVEPVLRPRAVRFMPISA